jgi:subtilisin
LGSTGEGIIVAVLDTGVDYTHTDLADNIWVNADEIPDNGIDDDNNGFIDDTTGWDFAYESNTPTDWYGHGTHVAGIIAGINDAVGVTGVAYNASIMPVTVIGDYWSQDGYEFLADLTDGIYYAVDNGADVINLSLGYDPAWFGGLESPAIAAVADAMAYAQAEGTVVVMAAGNEYSASPGYPAAYACDWGISVGACDSEADLANFSNNAGFTQLDYVVAPGVEIYSTIPWEGDYAYFSGTSMASPYVAGVVALIMAANPDLSAEEIEALLTTTANLDMMMA